MSTHPPATVNQAQSGSRRSLLLFVLTWIFISGLAVLSISALKAPQPLPNTAPANEFSAERAYVHVREIARAPHPLGSPTNETVRNYLLAQLSYVGVQSSVFTGMGVDPTAHLVIGGRTRDIVGLLPGTAGGQAIMLMAHYDSVPHAPGAGDDASGVAAILEAVRALRAGSPLQRDLIILFTDGEENGLLGAEAFTHAHPWARNVGLIMNFDARGDRGPSMLFETSRNNAALVDAVARVAPHPVGSSLFYEIYKSLPNDTDFTVFRRAGVPGLNFAFGEGLEAYHTSFDTPDHLSQASLQHQGSYAVALVRHFGQLDLAAFQASHGDDIFFNWFGGRLIAYRQSWVLPGQLLVTVLLAIVLIIGSRSHTIHARQFLLALPACLIFMAAVVSVAAGGWWLIELVLGARRISADSQANLFLLSGLMVLSACVGVLLLKFFSRRLGPRELFLAALLLWCVFSWLLALMLPSGSYLLFWPLLLAVTGVLSANFFRTGESGSSIRNLPAVAAAILLFAPVAYLSYIFLTLQMTAILAGSLLVALFLLLSIPLLEASSGLSSTANAGILGFAALACLIAGIVLSGHTPEHPQADSLVYSLNADENSAVWISYDPLPDDWTRRLLTTNPHPPQPLQKYLAGLARPFLSAKAPVLPLLPPIAENIEHKLEGEIHRLKLTIRSQRNANALYLRFPEGIQPVSTKVAGRDVPIHKGGRFGLTWSGMGNEGLELELAVTGPSVFFWLMDRSNGLPVDVPSRPANFTVEDGSDVTFVCRKYAF